MSDLAEIALVSMDKEREIIAQGFWSDLERVLAETPQMTATQALKRVNYEMTNQGNPDE